MNYTIASEQSSSRLSAGYMSIVRQPVSPASMEREPQKSWMVEDKVNLHQSQSGAATYNVSQAVGEGGRENLDLLQAYVANLLKEAGVAVMVATGEGGVDISTLTPAEAQELIAEDGYLGVEQTSQRIVDFAIAAAGGDPSRLAAVREGVERGFQEAKDAFGGWLPDISYQTYDAVMEKLDIWEASAS
jgi:hypothetical protein